MATNSPDVRGMKPGDRTPVVLVTDVGRDIDDTLALIALCGYEQEERVKIVGVVGTGGVPRERARLARTWLRLLMGGERGGQVPVAYDEQPEGVPGKPGFFPIPDMVRAQELETDFNLYKTGGAQLILDMAQQHRGKLHLICISPLTPVAEALRRGADGSGLRAVREGVVQIHMQGQAQANDEGFMAPDFQAFNLSEDKAAASEVFEKLQGHIPFRLLGKHAAYRVSINRGDFQRWDSCAGDKGYLTECAKLGLQGLKEHLPAVFDRLYPMPPDRRDQPDWFDAIDVVSHPYDPLLVTAGCNEHLFDGDVVQPRGASGIWHELIGMKEGGVAGVTNAEKAKGELSRAVDVGVQLIVRYKS